MTTPQPARRPSRGNWNEIKIIGGVVLGVIGFAVNIAYWTDRYGFARGTELVVAASASIYAVGLLIFTPIVMGRPTKGRLLTIIALVAIAVTCSVVFAATAPQRETATAQLMREWDGKFAKDVPNCADPPPTAVLDGVQPEVIGPDGSVVSRIQLHSFSKHGCPPLIWAWVPWHGDPAATYQIPAGWTLHVVIRRDVTQTRIDEPEPARPLAVKYPISRMLIATDEAGCVAVDAFFTGASGLPATPTATTACRTVAAA